MEYSRIISDDIENIVHITLDNLTGGMAISNEMENHVKAGNYFGIKATENGDMKGFIAVTKGIEFTLPHPELEEELSKRFPREMVMTGDGAYVDPSCRRKGICSELVHRMMKQMLDMGCHYLLAELWEHPDGVVPMKTPVELFGTPVFEKRIPLFYKDISHYGMICPICGTNCKCSALVRVIDIRANHDKNI